MLTCIVGSAGVIKQTHFIRSMLLHLDSTVVERQPLHLSVRSAKIASPRTALPGWEMFVRLSMFQNQDLFYAPAETNKQLFVRPSARLPFVKFLLAIEKKEERERKTNPWEDFARVEIGWMQRLQGKRCRGRCRRRRRRCRWTDTRRSCLSSRRGH